MQVEPRKALWRLYESAAALDSLYEATEGECTEQTEALEAWLADATDDAIVALCEFRREADGMAEVVKAEKERLDAVAKRAADRKAWASAKLLELLQRKGVKSVKAGTFAVSRKVGSESVQLDESFAIEELPIEFKRIQVAVDKSAIKTALKAGEGVPFAKLVRGPETVVVK